VFNCNIAVFMSFSNICLLAFVLIELVLSAYNTGLPVSDMKFGKSLIYKRKSRGPSMDPCGTNSFAVNLQVFPVLWNKKVCWHVHKSFPFVRRL